MVVTRTRSPTSGKRIRPTPVATSSAELKPSVASARDPGGDAYQLVVTPPARRAIASKLPEAIAVAVIDFLTMSLVH